MISDSWYCLSSKVIVKALRHPKSTAHDVDNWVQNVTKRRCHKPRNGQILPRVYLDDPVYSYKRKGKR